MELKVGGTYKRRDGVVVKITCKSELNIPYKFVGDKGHTYTEEGIYCLGGYATFDLISEVSVHKDNPYGEDNHPLPPMKEEGTLAELKVQPGDVVEWLGGDVVGHLTVKSAEVIPSGMYSGEVQAKLSRYGLGIFGDKQRFKLISRADKPPRTWGELNDAEKGALLLAHHEGKTIENSLDGFKTVYTVKPFWAKDYAYRIKPEPKVLVEKKRGTMVFHDGVMVEGSWRSEEDIYNNESK